MSVKNYYTETVRHRKSEIQKTDKGKEKELTNSELAEALFLKHLNACLRETTEIDRDPQIDSLLNEAQNRIRQHYVTGPDAWKEEKDIFEFAMTTASLILRHGGLQQKEKEGQNDGEKS